MMFNNQDDPTFTPPDPTPAPAPENPWTPEDLAAARAWAQDYYTSHKIPATYGTVDDLVNHYEAQRRAGMGHQAAMDAVPGILGWDKYTPTTPPGGGPPPGPTPPPNPGPGTIGSLIAPFTEKFAAPTPQDLPGLPGLTLPTFRPGPAFEPPTLADAQNEPGFQFRVNEGRDTLEHSAAARGVLNSGGTLQDLINYGQNAASQEYQNVYNRKRDTYALNYGTQVVDPFKFDYQRTLDTFAPQLAQWQVRAQNTQHQNDVSNTNAYNTWLQDYNIFRNHENDTFDKIFKYATA